MSVVLDEVAQGSRSWSGSVTVPRLGAVRPLATGRDVILPENGQETGVRRALRAPFLLVRAGSLDDLVDHLVRSTPLSTSEASRVVADVVGYFGESVQEFVTRRHAELQDRGLTNDRIFAMLGAELPARRVIPPPLSARQLRRIVYG